jgi:putative oxidoreductase
LFTPAAAGTLIGVMNQAIRTVHLKNGPWVTQGGYEYNLVLIATLVALADVGPGDLSLDHAFGIELNGPLVALLALAGGVAGAALVSRSEQNEPAGAGSIPGDPASAQDSTATTVDPTAATTPA